MAPSRANLSNDPAGVESISFKNRPIGTQRPKNAIDCRIPGSTNDIERSCGLANSLNSPPRVVSGREDRVRVNLNHLHSLRRATSVATPLRRLENGHSKISFPGGRPTVTIRPVPPTFYL